MNHGTEGYVCDGPEREIVPPTHEQLTYDEDTLKSVSRELDDSWRHGNRVDEVWKRERDGTYWFAHYRLSTDGETNELRDGECDITRVYPVTKTIQVTEYVTKDKL